MNDTWHLYLLSHTHWDREWYFTFQQYRHRLVKLMDRLLDLFERDPRYKYFTLDGQTLPLRDYLEIRPERWGRCAGLSARAGCSSAPGTRSPTSSCRAARR